MPNENIGLGVERVHDVVRLGEVHDAAMDERRCLLIVGGFPMTYMIDGTQYLAIPTGSSILPQFSAPLTPESIAPADRQEGRGSTLMVFKLTKTQ
jgi:hypothetical protein